MLPILITPDPSESLRGLLARSARHMGVPVAVLARYAQLRTSKGRFRNLLGPIDRATRLRLRHEFRLTEAQLDNLTMARFPGLQPLVPESPDHELAPLNLQRQQWWIFDVDRFCPTCLPDGRTWNLTWQLPWMFACPDHGTVLRQACASCRAPSRLITIQVGATDERCACGRPWADTPGPSVDHVDIALQRELLAPTQEAMSTIWGSSVPSLEVLRAWRDAAVLLAGKEPAPRWAARPWLTPPAAEVAAVVFPLAAAIVTADTAATGADALRALFDGFDEQVTNGVRDRLPEITPLRPILEAWQVSRERLSTRLAHRQRQGGPALLGARRIGIPTLAPLPTLPKRWRSPGAPDILLRRCAVSLACARLAGGSTWAECGSRVGVSERYAGRVTRHVLGQMGVDAVDELATAAAKLATSISSRVAVDAFVADPPVDSFRDLKSFATATSS